MPNPSDRIFDRVFLGDIVTGSQVLRDGCVAARGEVIAAIGQGAPPSPSQTIWDGITVLACLGTGRFIRRTTQ